MNAVGRKIADKGMAFQPSLLGRFFHGKNEAERSKS